MRRVLVLALNTRKEKNAWPAASTTKDRARWHASGATGICDLSQNNSTQYAKHNESSGKAPLNQSAIDRGASSVVAARVCVAISVVVFAVTSWVFSTLSAFASAVTGGVGVQTLGQHEAQLHACTRDPPFGPALAP